jgi:carnitine-CoA ligase
MSTTLHALGVTSVNVAGAILEFLAAQPASGWVDSPLRTNYAAPGPPPAQRDQLEARFGVRILTGYWMSENPFGCAESPTSRMKANSIGSMAMWDPQLAALTRAFRVVRYDHRGHGGSPVPPGPYTIEARQPASRAFENELRIVDPDGGDLERGEVGELCFRNSVMSPGYWNARVVTAATIKNGWLHTGDTGFRDEDGDVFLTGRFKEMIRRRGENIAPAEVEDALLAHPSVRAAAVFGVPAGLYNRKCRPPGKPGTARRGHQPDSGSRHKEGGPR